MFLWTYFIQYKEIYKGPNTHTHLWIIPMCFIQNFQKNFCLMQLTVVSNFSSYTFKNFCKSTLAKTFIL